jgi:hypothetical protein
MSPKSIESLLGPDAAPGSAFVSIVERMIAAGQRFEQGLRQSSIDVIEERSGFRFPPDLREFWSVAYPVGKGWHNWRDKPPSPRSVQDWISHGLVFDVEHNGLWLLDWGEKPTGQEAARKVVATWVSQGPPLLPLYSHRVLVGGSLDAGNPVLSIHQSDWIYYGWDLPSYLAAEFLDTELDRANPPDLKSIGQWDKIVS